MLYESEILFDENQDKIEHCFFDHRYVMYQENDIWKKGDLNNLEDRDRLILYKENEIRNYPNLTILIHNLNMSYLPEFFEKSRKYYSNDEYNEWLIHIWKRCDWGMSTYNKEKVLEWFIEGKNKHNANTMLNRKRFEDNVLNYKLKNIIDVYTSENDFCISWTLDKNKIEENNLIHGTVLIGDILAYIEENDSVIINPKDVKIVGDY